MKKFLQMMLAMVLTTITSINLIACNFMEKSPPINWDQRLDDAANLISSDSDVAFTNHDKNKTKVSDFLSLITNRIRKLFSESKEDFSLILYDVMNKDDKITDSTAINLELSVYRVSNVKKSCSFVAKFTSVKEFVNKILEPYTKKIWHKKYFTLSKKDNFYNTLIGYGANFKQIIPKEPNFFKTDDSGPLGKASDFWNAFKTAEGDEKVKVFPLANVLFPIFQLFPNDDTGLTFFNFEATLQNYQNNSNVIALTGHKDFDGHSYDYIEINLKGVKTNDVDLDGNYNGLTYIFK